MATIATVGVLALQGAFHEHIKLLETAVSSEKDSEISWTFLEVRTPIELLQCDALIIPGGESTTMSLVAARSGLLEPLRDFVKVYRRPTWGTCAGLILLSESANRTKQGGQDLIGGLDVRVSRNFFGRQTESFEAELDLPFLALRNIGDDELNKPYRGIFIRAPVVEKVLPVSAREQVGEAAKEDMVVAPSRSPGDALAEQMVARPVEVMATLPGRTTKITQKLSQTSGNDEAEDIVAVRQGNVFGTSFHPELTCDARIHAWWLQEVRKYIRSKRTLELRS
ncbi:hypothetical protein MMC18_001081 [Xylographa bjoerkii]|nr:hypothetical protein [Xylographa bjoerkii]